MKHPEHYIIVTNILMKARKGAELYIEDETRENWSGLSTVNILSVTNPDQFSPVQYSLLCPLESNYYN